MIHLLPLPQIALLRLVRVPPDKKDGKPPGIEFELITNNPYAYTQEELLYEVHIRHKNIPETELAERGNQIRDEFLGSRNHA